MIQTRVEWYNSGALRRRLVEVSASTKLDSRPMRRLKQDIGAALELDNEDKILNRSVDRFGRALARLSPRTLANPRRGYGPPLAPRGASSRFITHFQVRWLSAENGWRCVAGWVNFVSNLGFPIPVAHLYGTRNIPKRDVGGVSPKGWSMLKSLFADFVKSIAAK